ncbi:MAG: response regulator [Planctomycetes bacterium]|nr:response regulator [Planctomycetota bacterium]
MHRKRTFTTGEVANYCGVNFRTVIRWIDRGHLKAFQLPGRGDRRVELDDLLAFLKKNGMPLPEDLVPLNNRILIVDDDENLCDTISVTLGDAGYETSVANDGLEVGCLLESFSPAVMILDLNIPGLDGKQVIKFIRSRDTLAALKIVVISGMDADEIAKVYDDGADAYLKKPFRGRELLDVLGKLISEKVA